MSSLTVRADKPTGDCSDPRPAYIWIGEDTQGASHVYDTRRERVIVIADGERTHVELLGGRPVDHWISYVRGKRGWRTQRLYASTADAWSALLEPLADSLEDD